MTDRIEALEHIIRDGFCTGQVHSFHEHHAAVRELATIAREANARIGEWVQRCYESDERANNATERIKELEGERDMERRKYLFLRWRITHIEPQGEQYGWSQEQWDEAATAAAREAVR